MNPIAAAVLFLFAVISGILSLLCGVIVRFCMYMSSKNHDFSWHDDASKLSGVIAGILFAIFFVTFVFKPLIHEEND